MMLRESKNKMSPTLGLLRATFIKNTGIVILLSVAMLILCPGFFITVLSKTDLKPENYFSPDALNILYGVTTAVSCLFVCIGNYVNFSYLYKKSSSDVFGALPLTRTGMLFARATATFLGVMIPVTIGYAALAFLSIPYPAYVTGTLSQIASAYLVNLLLMLAFSGFSLIFIICAGSGFDLIISFGGFNVACLITGAILNSLCDKYLSGFSENFLGFLRTLSPVYYLAERALNFADAEYAIKGSAYILLGILKYAAAFFIIAPVLYNFRKAERGEQAYAYKFIYVVCGVLAGICGGYALSQMFILAADSMEYSLIGFVSFATGALITTVVYGAVTDRGFKGFKHALAIGGVSVIVYALIAVIITTGAFGFEKRVPEAKDVANVKVGFKTEYVEIKNVEAVTALHGAIVEKDADDKEEETVDSSHEGVRIDYKLKDGGEMNRAYFVKTSAVKKELFDVYSSDEWFAKAEKLANAAKDGKLSVNGYYNVNTDEDELLGGEVSRNDFKKIISVYRKELNALGEEFFTEEQQTGTVADVSFEAETEKNYETFGITTTSRFPETNKLLSALIESEEELKK